MDIFNYFIYFTVAFAIAAIVLLILFIVSLLRIYHKADKPQWAAIIPVYNTYVLLQIVRKPTWWLVFFLLPFINYLIDLAFLEGIFNIASFVAWIMVLHRLSKVFGKGTGFTIGLVLLPIIFFPILAFGKSSYLGENSSNSLPPQSQVV